MHGKGIYTWKDGRSYEGTYYNDKKHGFGIYKWADRRSYEGMWMESKQHGKGKYILPDGTSKIGRWSDGKRIEWLDDDTEINFVAEIEELEAFTKKKESEKEQSFLEKK